jgi:phosphatidylglycerol:prolipoprotein diacylglycerol transferase
VLDAVAPGILVGIAIVDVAALLIGRNAGLPAPQGVPWAVNLWGVPRHPVQLYEALAALAVAALALWMIARGSRPGSAALVALCGYGWSRWLLEPFRAPEASVTILGGLRLAQVVGLAAALIALWGLGRLAARTD